jgi:O-antigen/teichoic acid export membrane protein
MTAPGHSNFRRMLTNMGTTVLSEVVNKLSPLVILHVAQKRLGVEMFGLAQYAIGFLEVLLPFVAFGYGTLGAIEVGRLGQDRQRIGDFISAVLALRVLHLLSVVIAAGVIVSTPAFAESRMIIGSIAFLLVATCFETEFLHYGQQTLSARNLILVVSKLVSLAGVLLFVRDAQDAPAYAVLACLPALLVSGGSAFYNLRGLPLHLPSFAEIKPVFLRAFPYSWVAVLLIISDRFDLFLAEFFFEKSGAGFYAGQLRIIQSITTAVSAFGLVFFTELVVPRPKEEFTRFVHYTLAAVLLVIAPITAGGFFVGKDLLSLILSPDFVPYARVFDILLLSTFVGGFFLVFGLYILMIKERVVFFNIALLIANVTGISVAAWAAGPYGLPGIAFGVLVTKLLASVCFIWGARAYIDSFPVRISLKILGCTAFMAAVLYAADIQSMPVTIAFGALAYGLAVAVTQFSFISMVAGRILRR